MSDLLGSVSNYYGTSANSDVFSTDSLGKDDFLQLLVAKMSNQDPLDPVSDEDFIADLAQFSSLEQMNNISEAISTSNQWDYLQMQSINNIMAAGLIGKEVKADYNSLYLDNGESSQIMFTTSKFASEIEFGIFDANGTKVGKVVMEDVQTGTQSVMWDGTDLQGNRLPDGTYTVKATAYDADGQEFKPLLSLRGIVESVLYKDGAAYLTVDGVEVSFSDISFVGAPEETEEEGGENG